MNVILEIPMRMAIQLFRLFVCFPFLLIFVLVNQTYVFSGSLLHCLSRAYAIFIKTGKTCKMCTVFVIMGGITS